jgi:hypothetical protein
MNELLREVSSTLPHQQKSPLLEQQGLLPFLGYQLLEQCMAYLNLQLRFI